MHPGRTYPEIPDDKKKQLRYAVRLEIWTLVFLASIVVVSVSGMSEDARSRHRIAAP